MEYEGCYNSAIELIEEASQEFGNRFTLNKPKYNLLKDVCEAVDNLVIENDCEIVDVSVDEAKKRFIIEVVCGDVVFYNGAGDGFSKLIRMLDSFSFSKRGRDSLCIAMNIDNMWKQVITGK